MRNSRGIIDIEYIIEHLRQYKQTKFNKEWVFFGDNGYAKVLITDNCKYLVIVYNGDSFVCDWNSFANVEYVVKYIEQKLG